MQELYKWVGNKIGGETGEKIANGVFTVADIGLGFISVGGAIKHIAKIKQLDKGTDIAKYLVKIGADGGKKALTIINPKNIYKAGKEVAGNIGTKTINLAGDLKKELAQIAEIYRKQGKGTVSLVEYLKVRKADEAAKAVGKVDDLKKSTGKVINIKEVSPLLKTEPNGAFFWSGRYIDSKGNPVDVMDKAAEIAKKNGGNTLETMIESKGIKMPEWDINNPDSIKAWEDVSAEYAKQVSGDVRAVVGSQLRNGNIWENVELPRLKANPKVKRIITIDPITLKEKIIFER